MADSKRLARARSSVPGVVLVLVAGFVLVSLVLRVVGAWRGVPVLSGDQVVFVPVARQWLEHGQLAHPFWAFPGASTNEYSWHGWLLPIALGWFSTARHAQTLLVGPAMLALLSVAAFAVYARVARLGAIRASTLLVLIGAIASYSIGRPESLLLGLWAAALIGERLLPGRGFDALAAVLLGVAIISQPVVAPAALVIFVIYAGCARQDLRGLASSVSIVTGGALLVAWGLTACSPLALRAWYLGLRRNAAYVASRTDGSLSDFVSYFLLHPLLPGAVLYLVLAVLVARELWTTPRTLGLRRATTGAMFLLVLFVLLMALRVPATVYNLVAIAPVLVAASLSATRVGLVRATLGACAVAAAASLAFGGFSIVAAAYGTPIEALQAALRERRPCAIAADGSSWLAVAEALGERHLCRSRRACPAQLILQANSGLLEPPAQLAGQPLVVDAFHRAAPSVWGLALGRTRKDYAFALYGDLSPCAE